MTDETGGKPTLATLLSSGYGGTLAKLMEADADHVTIPTAALAELLAAAEEAIGTITSALTDNYLKNLGHPTVNSETRMRYTSRLRTAVARVRGE